MMQRSVAEMEPVLQAMRRWALAHPRSDLPFMVVQGRTFTPKTFLKEVTIQSRFAEPFLTYLFNEAERQSLKPTDLIEIAIRNQRK
jgi:hypothetical protein